MAARQAAITTAPLDLQGLIAAVADVPNVYLDLSGSGVDRGMLDDALAAVGAGRLVWGSDVTMETGLAKLRALEVIGLSAEDLARIRWRTAAGLFPPGSVNQLVELQLEEFARERREFDSPLPPPSTAVTPVPLPAVR